MKLESFRKDCLKLEADVIVQKYLIDGSSYYFDEISDLDEFQFKKDIAESLDVHIRDIVIVGSGKLGFSIKPDQETSAYFPFKKFDYDYIKDNNNDKSDLDIAIVSNNLFDKQLVRLYEHTGQYSNNEVWNGKRDRNFLAQYILKGWLKPDFIPKDYKISDGIKIVQQRYKRLLGRDINIGIYKNWYFFESYHINNIRKINLILIAND